MIVRSNGDILFQQGEPIPVLKLYRPSDNNSLLFVAKFDSNCICRAFVGGISPCAKRLVFKWKCNKLNQQVDPTICNQCQVVENGK